MEIMEHRKFVITRNMHISQIREGLDLTHKSTGAMMALNTMKKHLKRA
jgi:hypothetical protein